MREISVTLGEKSYTLRANFRASAALYEKVGDPMWMAREAMLENIMLERGLNYEPKFMFDIFNTALVIWIGANEYDKDVKLEEIQDSVFNAGFYIAREKAVEYIGEIIGPQPDLEADVEREADSGVPAKK